jgi:dihydroxyacid dehydratase/phosphogluconate dehydratase
MKKRLNSFSSQITQQKSQGASQAMLYATGLDEADMNKPEVGIASVWFEGNPCNMHLLALSEKVKQGVKAAGLVGMRFNTIGVSDGISMGTDGMSFSLQSRQEHAWLHYCHGKVEPAQPDDLRGNHPSRASRSRKARHRFRIPELWPVHCALDQ